MKKYMMMTVLMMAVVSASAQSKPEPYFSFRELPNMLKWCPAPPDTVGAAFAYDIMQYMWGKEIRQKDKARTEIAIRDAVYSLECIMQEFGEPLGLQMSEEETPEIYKLLRDAKATCENISNFPKFYYKRIRPFMRFHEHTATPQFEPDLRRNFSYPSGHTILGWCSALLLSEINPERADTIVSSWVPTGRATSTQVVWLPLPSMPVCIPVTGFWSRCNWHVRSSASRRVWPPPKK